MALAAGTKLGPYEIVASLGAGGMGEVYRARDPRLGREVAIKVLLSYFCRDVDRLRRFEQEARAAGSLNHPNVLAVYDVGTHEGAPYLVTELLEGATLRDRMAGGAMPLRKATEYAAQVAHGLAAAHDKGIVHRDLKPENIFVCRDGRTKILDFGLAKLTAPEAGDATATNLDLRDQTGEGVVLGTVGYMSPEQVRGEKADERSDVFSFGAVLYEMLSGERAFAGGSSADRASAILKEDPPDLRATGRNIPPAMERIVRHCLEKSRDERFQSARDLGFHLETVLTDSEPNAAASFPLQKKRIPPRLGDRRFGDPGGSGSGMVVPGKGSVGPPGSELSPAYGFRRNSGQPSLLTRRQVGNIRERFDRVAADLDTLAGRRTTSSNHTRCGRAP